MYTMNAAIAIGNSFFANTQAASKRNINTPIPQSLIWNPFLFRQTRQISFTSQQIQKVNAETLRIYDSNINTF